MAKYRKKPVVIEAVQWNGSNQEAIYNHIGNNGYFSRETGNLFITTPEGLMSATVGDYIIKGVNAEFYPCKEEIFIKTYDLV